MPGGGVVEAIAAARELAATGRAGELPGGAVRDPGLTIFDRAVVGPVAALVALVGLFAVPVYAAYRLASWAQGPVDDAVITPLK